MKFGVREIANVVFRAKAKTKIGNIEFQNRQPVLYLDTATTSTLEGAATTVYAQGGRGNSRLIAWEGEKTLTFTVEDALLSPIGFSILSGAGLVKGAKDSTERVNIHTTTTAAIEYNDTTKVATINITDALLDGEELSDKAPLYVLETESDGSISGRTYGVTDIAKDSAGNPTGVLTLSIPEDMDTTKLNNTPVMVDYYVNRASHQVSEIQIDAEHFAGYYYVEADTLFRREDNGVDMPAILTLPKVKIQSNFTFTMASSGDPSTFTFTMDAFPDYTYFNKKKKVLCAIQVVEDVTASETTYKTVMPHGDEDNVSGAEDEDTSIGTNADPTDTERNTYRDNYKKTI